MSIYQDDKVTLHHGDCLDVLATLPDASVDAVVTDPPYGLANTDPRHVEETFRRWINGERDYLPGGRGFMGKEWDAFVPPVAVWDECLRVLKPGGHVLTFAGSRTVDLMTLGLRLAGFDIRDSLAWLYGSGFPKSMDVSKAIDKAGGDPLAFRRFARAYAEAVEGSPLTHSDVDRHLGIKSSSCYWAREDHRGGMPPRHHWEAARALLGLSDEFVRLYDAAEREVIGVRSVPMGHAFAGATYGGNPSSREVDVTAPTTDAAREWQGWGTALKPAFEPIVMARKPLTGTVAANVLEHGTGALNIDACRIGSGGGTKGATAGPQGDVYGDGNGAFGQPVPGLGRWPANVILDESQAEALDEQSGTLTTGAWNGKRNTPRLNGVYGHAGIGEPQTPREKDSGGASRFFYVAKAPKSERPVYWIAGCNCETVKPCEEPSPRRATDDSRSGDAKSWSTCSCGNRCTDPCQKGTTSITETMTSSTTGSKTYNSSLSWSTSGSTLDVKSGGTCGGSPAEYVESSSRSRRITGTSAQRVGPSMEDAAHATSPKWSEPSNCAACGTPPRRVAHETVKPVSLMSWLVRLVTPPGGTVLEPFAGSGTTVEAAMREGFNVVAVEREADYLPLIMARIERENARQAAVAAATVPTLFDEEAGA